MKPHRLVFGTLLAVSLALGLSVGVVEAQTVSQSLTRGRSTVRFTLDSPMLQLAGRIPDISGSVQLDPTSQQPRSVDFHVDLSSVELDPADGGLAMLSPEALFRSLPSPVASFRSTSITQIDDHSYQVKGLLTRAGRSWNLNVPIKRLRQSATEALYFVKLAGPLNLQDLSLPIASSAGKGAIEGQLLFQRR